MEQTQFRDTGYLVMRDVLPLDAVNRTRGIAVDLFSRYAGREVGDFLDLNEDDMDVTVARLPQILMPIKYAPELEHSELRTVAWIIARDLLGDAAQYQGEHIIAKPAGFGAETLPHQDEAFWSGELEYECISIWMPLQNVTETDGCLKFGSGSHQNGVRSHRPAGGKPACNSFELVGPTGELTPQPMLAGSLSVHHCRVIHGAGPNSGSATRYAYIYGFGLPAKRASNPRDFAWQRLQETARQARADVGRYALTKMRPEA